MSRARRGLLVLRELKRDPHRIVAMMSVDDATRLNVLTDTGKVTTLIRHNIQRVTAIRMVRLSLTLMSLASQFCSNQRRTSRSSRINGDH